MIEADAIRSARGAAQLRRSFDRASHTYDGAAVLHADVRKSLLERLDLTALTPRLVLDAGAGTGHASRALKRRYPKSRVIALDFALGMLQTAARQQPWLQRFDRVCADAVCLPLADSSVDLILSNLMLHWCDPDAILAEFRRVLAPEGFLSFTSFGPDTLRELRSAWAEVDPHAHVNQFIDMHDLGDALVRAGFKGSVLDVERYTLSYTEVPALMADLKAVGSRNIVKTQTRGLTSPAKFAAMSAAYQKFRQAGRIPASYEVVFAHAWAPARTAAVPANQTTVSLQELKRQLAARRTS